MLTLNRLFYVVLLLQSTITLAQTKTNPTALLFPLNPGTANTRAGTMGELRSSHFHTGIDIRTGGQEGLSVKAADDGYVSRIAVKEGGYGNTVYIKHPNGHTTVYAHLKSFRKDIANYVRKQQYRTQKFSVNLFPESTAFQVKRGDEVAISGNSGSSGGPHLHFDVRNRNQDLLNPLHYGFSEITDIRPPLAKALALVTTSIDDRVNGEFGRIEIPIRQEKNLYSISDTIYAKGRIGLELLAHDRMNNTRFRTGINKIEVNVNNSIHMITTIDTWPFSKARQFYTYVNYEALANYSKRYHKLYIDEGNHLNFYSNTTDKGYITIEDNKIYSFDITLTDSYNNKSEVHFVIKGSPNPKAQLKNTDIPFNNWKVVNNILVVKSNARDTLGFYTKGKLVAIEKSFSSNENTIYLWDLRTAIPDSISINGSFQVLPLKAVVSAGVAYHFYHPIADIQFWKSTLFADLFLSLESKIDTVTGFEVISIGDPSIPLNKNFTVNFKPSHLPANKQFLGVYAVWGKNSSYIGGKWSGEQISFKSRNFGKYTLLADSIPPTIKPVILNSNQMVFKISDNLSGIKKFSMHLNKEWVLMNYDPKKNLIWAEKPNLDFIFKGKLELKVSDNIGNEKMYTTELN